MEADQTTSDDAPRSNETVHSLAEDIAEFCYGEVVGVASDGNRFGIKTDSIGKTETRLAMKNGFAIEQVREAGISSDSQQFTFVRLTEF